MLRLLEEQEEERDPYEEGDALVGPAVVNALQLLGRNITNSSNATDVCCHLREAGANVSEMWPWDCHDVHLCAVVPGFQLPIWVKVIIVFVVLVVMVVGGTVWYIRWDHARGMAIKQAQLTGVGLSSPRTKTKKAPRAKLPKSPGKGKGLKLKPVQPDGPAPARGSGRASAQHGDATWDGLAHKMHLGDELGDDEEQLHGGEEEEETSAAEPVAVGDGAKGGAAQPGKEGAEPEPEPEPESTAGWGKLEGWQYHPAKQHIFEEQVRDLAEKVRFLSADADRLKLRLGRPEYKSGMIDGQDRLMENYKKEAKKVEKQLKRRMRQLEQNCGAEVSDDEDEREEKRRARQEREKQQAGNKTEEDIEYEESSPDAESTPLGRQVIGWMTRNGIRAKKGTLADKIIDALTQTSLTAPDVDQGKAWLDALEAMPDDHRFLLALEGKTEKMKFDQKVERAKHTKALKNLHESGKLKGIMDPQSGQLSPSPRAAPSASLSGTNPAQASLRARRYWLQLKTAVRLGGFITNFIEGSREERAKQERAAQEEKEAEEAKRALEKEMREADVAAAKAEAAEKVAADALVLLDREQTELENARRVLKKAEVQATNARSAVQTAERAVMNPSASILLLRLGGLKNADRDGASDPMVKVFWNDKCIHDSQVYQNDNAPDMQEKVVIDAVSSTEPDTLRCEVWDYDPVGEGEFLGQYEVTGNVAQVVGTGHVQSTDLLPSNAGKFRLVKSTKGHPGKYVGGSISLGSFQLYTEQAAKDLNNARIAERRASEELQEAADTAAREKEEADDQRAVLLADMKIAEDMTAAAKKELDDCKRAQMRLKKEEAEAMSARMEAGAKDAGGQRMDQRMIEKLDYQLRSLQNAERNYCDMKMNESAVYAEILSSMAHTLQLQGAVVAAAVRSAEAALVANAASTKNQPQRHKRRMGPPQPTREFVDI